MLKLPTNSHAVLGLSLANLALFLASGLLLCIILEGAYGSLWEHTAQLQATADTLNTSVETLSAAYQDTRLTLPPLSQSPTIRLSCSTQYIHVWSQSDSTTSLSLTTSWTIPPWPRPNDTWQSGDELHQWLNATYGHLGTPQDPINETILQTLRAQQEAAALALAYDPLEYTTTSTIFIEKTYLSVEQETPYTVLLLYQ